MSLCFELCSTITPFMYVSSTQWQAWQSSHLGIFTALKLLTNLIKILQGDKFLSFLTCCFPCTAKSNVIRDFYAPQIHVHNFCVFRENNIWQCMWIYHVLGIIEQPTQMVTLVTHNNTFLFMATYAPWQQTSRHVCPLCVVLYKLNVSPTEHINYHQVTCHQWHSSMCVPCNNDT
jgi:hypothetical protein